MATKREAREHWKKVKRQFKIERGIRFALTGDGKGTAASNFYHPTDKRYMWAREHSNPDRPFPVLNKGLIRPAVNVPVVLGYAEDNKEEEQVLGINWAAVPAGSTFANYSIGEHHQQHEWGGGDEIFIDGRQLLYGLLVPTNPASLQMKVKAFTYFYSDGWARYAGGTTISMSPYLPSTGNARAVLVVYDQKNEALDYIIGTATSTGTQTWDALIGGSSGIDNWLSIIPDWGEHHMVLGAALLQSDTAKLNFQNIADSTILDLRRHADRYERAWQVGQARISPDGKTYQSGIPITDEQVGLIIDEKTGYILVA